MRLIVLGFAAGLSLLQQPAMFPGTGAGRSLASVGLRLSQARDQTVVAATRPAGLRRLVLPPEDGIFADSLGDTQLIGAVPRRVVIFRTDYASRPRGATHQCGAGTETVLRVVALRPSLRQTLHTLLESCWKTIDDSHVAWSPGSRQLTVELTTYDPDMKHVRTLYQVTDTGDVIALSKERLP